jgi:hypothetical protein
MSAVYHCFHSGYRICHLSMDTQRFMAIHSFFCCPLAIPLRMCVLPRSVHDHPHVTLRSTLPLDKCPIPCVIWPSLRTISPPARLLHTPSTHHCNHKVPAHCCRQHTRRSTSHIHDSRRILHLHNLSRTPALQ